MRVDPLVIRAVNFVESIAFWETQEGTPGANVTDAVG